MDVINIRIIKIDGFLEEFYPAFDIDEDTGEIIDWNVPNNPQEYYKLILNTLEDLTKNRILTILKNYNYYDLSSLKENLLTDPNVKFILDWYNNYSNLIKDYLNNLKQITDIFQLIQIDLINEEENIYNQSIQLSPHPEILIQTLDGKKKFKIHEVYLLRKQKEFGGIILIDQNNNEYILDTSPVGRGNLQASIDIYEKGFIPKTQKITWKFENDFKNISYDDLLNMAKYVTDYIENLFKIEGYHNLNILKLTNITDVDNYDINLNWPDNKYQINFNE